MNKFVFLCTFALAAMQAPHSVAQSRSDRATFQYGGIAGAWFINARCRFLNADEVREFEWHVAQVTLYLRSRGADESALGRIRSAAKQRASRVPYTTCNQAGREFVRQGFAWAKGISRSDMGLRYGPRKIRKFRLLRYMVFLRSMTAARKCGLLQDPRGKQLVRRMKPVYDKVVARLKELYGKRQISLTTFDAMTKARPVPCGKAGRLFIHAVGLLRRLQADLKV